MKKNVSFLVVVVLILVFLSPILSTKKVSAEGANWQLTLDSGLSNWVMDNSRNAIYSVSKTGILSFISMDTFTVTNKVSLGGASSDLDIDGNDLFVSVPGLSEVIEVNLDTQKIIETINLPHVPNRIAIANNQLFYVNDDTGYLYDFSLLTQSEKVVTISGESYSMFNEADLEADGKTNTLYIADSNLSGCNIKAISTADFSLKSESTYDEGSGFDYAKRNLLLKGDTLFFAGRALDATNLEDIQGEYVDSYSDNYFDNDRIPADILDVNDNYVFATDGVYNRSTFAKIETFPSSISDMLVNNSNIYIFNSENNTIYKMGYRPEDISLKSTLSNNKLSLNHNLTDWVVDDQKHRIYAISKTSNELIYMNSDTMEVIGTEYIGSMPSDIVLVNDHLYIADSGGTTISVTGTTYGDPIRKITTKQNPYRLATDGSYLYYVDENQWSFVYKVNLTDGTEKVLDVPNENDALYEPDLVYDSASQKLFVGESGLSGSNLYLLDQNDGTHLEQTDFDSGYGFPYPSRQLILNGEDLFYSGYRLPKEDLTNEAVKYFNADFTQEPFEKYVFVNGQHVFSDKSIYNRTTGEKVYTFPSNVELASESSTGQIFVYVPSKEAIYRFDSLDALENQDINNIKANFNNSNQFQISWDGSTGDGYNVYDLTDLGNQTILNKDLISATTFTLTDSQLINYYGKTVKFSVGSSFCGRVTPVLKSLTYTFEIPVPSHIQLNKEGTEVSWDPIKLMDGYNVYAYLDDSTNKVKLNENPITTNTIVIDPTYQKEWAGKAVTFEVTSIINGKESKLSDPIQYTFAPLSTETSSDSSDPQQSDTQQSNSQSINNQDTTNSYSNQDHQSNTNLSTSTNSSTSTNTNILKKTSSLHMIKIVPKVSNGEASFSDKALSSLKFGDRLNIDLSNTVEQSTVNVLFTASQLKKLEKENSSISIKNRNVGLYIPISIFGTNDVDTKVTIKQVSEVKNALSNVYDFKIRQGSTIISHFDHPITLTFKVDPAKIQNPNDAKIFYWNEEKQIWELIGGTYKDGSVTAETYHFSTYTVFDKTKVADTTHADKHQKVTKVASNTLKTKSEDDHKKNYSIEYIFVSIIGIGLILLITFIVIRKRKRFI